MYKEIYLFLTNQCPNRCHYCYIKYNNDCLTEKDIDECIEQNKPNRVYSCIGISRQFHFES